jgi:hypothetical protein
MWLILTNICANVEMSYGLFDMTNMINYNDNNFIRVSLGGMGYSRRSYKKTIPNYKFIKSQFQTKIF